MNSELKFYAKIKSDFSGNKMFNFKRKKAFTLSESMTVLVVIGIVSVLTIATNVNVETLKTKQIITASQEFYSTVITTLQNVLMNNSTNYDLKNLKDENGDNIVDSVDLRNYFVKYLDGEIIDCSEILINTDSIKDYLDSSFDPQCAYFVPKIKAAFVYDKDCSMEVVAKEYLTKSDTEKETKNKQIEENSDTSLPETNTRVVNKACGYVLYSYINADGIFAKDTFIIPFGSSRVK